MKSIHSVITLTENETPIKTYHCTSLKSLMMKCEGYITVTNKRIVLHAHSSSSTGNAMLISEAPIETVSGITSYIGNGYSVWMAVLTFLFGLGTLSQLGSIFQGSDLNFQSLTFALVCGAITYYLFNRMRANVFNLQVFTSGANGIPISLGGGLGIGITGQNISKALSAEPAQDSHLLIKELGALVLDLKSLGDMAIEKWQVNS